MKILYTFFYSFFALLLLCIVGLFLMPLLPISNNITIKIVESGSMEPAISTGSIVIVRPSSVYNVGDVITFKSFSADVPTTHRIQEKNVENSVTYFTTKGDANEDADTNQTPESAVFGKVILAVPYVGFILDFARQPFGFVLLIVLPALLIVAGEIEKIWKEVRAKRNRAESKTDSDTDTRAFTETKNDQHNVRMMEIAVPIFIPQKQIPQSTVVCTQTSVLQQYVVPFVIVCVGFLFAGMSFTGSTISYFNDIEQSLANVLQASLIDFSVSPSAFAYTFANNQGDEFAADMVITPLLSSRALEYNLHVEKVSGSDALCAALVADAGSPIVYTGPLLSFAAGGVELLGPWTLGVSLNPLATGYLPTDVCVLNLIFEGKHISSGVANGYSDIESVQLTFNAPPAVIEPIIQPFRAFAPAETVPDESLTPESQEIIIEQVPEESPEGEPLPPEATPEVPTNEPEGEPVPEVIVVDQPEAIVAPEI